MATLALEGIRAGRVERHSAWCEVIAITIALWSASTAHALADSSNEGTVYPVERIDIQYHRDFGLLPIERPDEAMRSWRRFVANPTDSKAVEDLSDVRVKLLSNGVVLVAAPADAAAVPGVVDLSLKEIGDPSRPETRLLRSALIAMAGEVIRATKSDSTGDTEETKKTIVTRRDSAMVILHEIAPWLGQSDALVLKGTFAENDAEKKLSEQTIGLEELQVLLANRDGVGVVPVAGANAAPLSVAFIGGQDEQHVLWNQLDAAAIQLICEQVGQQISAKHGDLKPKLFVVPDPQQIDPKDQSDRRTSADRGTLRLFVAFEGPQEDPSYAVRDIKLGYRLPQAPGTADTLLDAIAADPSVPTVAEVKENVRVRLVLAPGGYLTDWHPGCDSVEFRLSQLDGTAECEKRLSLSAVQRVLDEIVRYLQSRDLMAVAARLAPDQVDLQLAGSDVRTDKSVITVQIVLGTIGDVRTVASGGRVDPEGERVNLPKDERIRTGSPLQPGAPEESILKKSVLTDYLDFRSRHPGRSVSAAVTPARATVGGASSIGSVGIDYMVNERESLLKPIFGPGIDPWLIYFQVSNTGTPETSVWQERVGIYNSQLFGHDEILSIDYVTSSLQGTYALTASFEAPVGDIDRLRYRIYGAFSEFDASEVGFQFNRFTGNGATGGAELIWNFFQADKWFADQIVGARYSNYVVDNELVDITGRQDFFIPYVGARLERATPTARTDIAVSFEFMSGAVTGVNPIEINALGRLFPSDNWVVLHWDAEQTLFLDPLFIADPTEVSLAHELAFRFRGQYAFGYRLIAEEEYVEGGMYTVRGYPQSIAVGDSAWCGTAEYRLHLPQLLGFSGQPAQLFGKPFRMSPQFSYGPTDWDLVLKAFVDAGTTYISEPFSFEDDQSLLGTGVGIELQLRQNVTIRADWGWALDAVPGLVTEGSSQFHFSASFVF